MKFHLQTPAGQNLFTGHGAGYVAINGVRYTQSIVVTPERVLDDWPASDFDRLTPRDFEFLCALAPEIVLLGTGATLRFPRPPLTHSLAAARIGLEVMGNAALCRTFNILVGEGRNVIAAVLRP